MQSVQLNRSTLASRTGVRLQQAQQCKPVIRPVVARASLFEKLGRRDAVVAAVDIFYQKVLADDKVNSYFQSTDMVKQKAHQAAFMTMAFGGPGKYAGKDMAAAHAHLLPHLEEVHFNAIVEHFVATLNDLGVPQQEIDEAVAVVATTKDAVLSRADVPA